jgi:hypothetical protein
MTTPKDTRGCVPISRESGRPATSLCTSSFTGSGSGAMKGAMPTGLILILIPQRSGLASLAKDCFAYERGCPALRRSIQALEALTCPLARVEAELAGVTATAKGY